MSVPSRWPTHRLEVVTSESLQSTLVSPAGDASGGVYLLEAKFKLIRVKAGARWYSTRAQKI